MISVSPRVPGENNKEYAYRVIKESIMSLELKPGQAISEIELAEALQLSRTPIREVLAKLREEHLIEVIPQVGTYISKINPQLITEASFMRFTLEREVLKLSCENFSMANLLDLKKNLAMQKELGGQKGTEREFHRLDKEFHWIIFQGNKKGNVWQAITRIGTHYNRIRLLSEMQHNYDDAVAQHEEITHIIENKQSQKVEDVVRRHILDPIKLWEDLLVEDSPYINYFEFPGKRPVFL
jgi:GntR family transcriptional regulator, rspAB operon transcriptional repressor